MLGAGVSAQLITARGGNGDLAFLNAVVSSTVDLAAPSPAGAVPRAQASPNAVDVSATPEPPATQTIPSTPSAPSTTAYPSADDFVAPPPSETDNPSGQFVVIGRRQNNNALARSSAFEDSQDYATEDGDQAPRISYRSRTDAPESALSLDGIVETVGSIFNPNRNAYPRQYGAVRTSGLAVNEPVGELARAFDLEMMDTRITPNVGTRWAEDSRTAMPTVMCFIKRLAPTANT